jgi:hypothetical protein
MEARTRALPLALAQNPGNAKGNIYTAFRRRRQHKFHPPPGPVSGESAGEGPHLSFRPEARHSLVISTGGRRPQWGNLAANLPSHYGRPGTPDPISAIPATPRLRIGSITRGRNVTYGRASICPGRRSPATCRSRPRKALPASPRALSSAAFSAPVPSAPAPRIPRISPLRPCARLPPCAAAGRC